MTYILPILFVTVSYTLPLLSDIVPMYPIMFLLPAIMGIINLIVVLTAGKTGHEKNCSTVL